MSEQKIDKRLERLLINRYVSMPKLYEQLGIDYDLASNMFCPYHDNTRTPSAKLYSDENGWCLWCFSEGKMYGAYDTYKRFTKINTVELAKMIYSKLDDDTRLAILKSLDIQEDKESLPYSKSLKEFKFRKLDFSSLLDKMVETYKIENEYD